MVASHDSERFNFSENTDLSELLFIARKLNNGEKPGDTTFINLWRNPRSIHEALDLATRLVAAKPVSVADAGVTTIRADRGKLAEIVTTPAPTDGENWTGALFAQTELLRAYRGLEHGELRIPGVKRVTEPPFCRLDALGALGPDQRRVHDGFKMSSDEWSLYHGFWNHDSETVVCIKQRPNCFLHVWLESPRGPDYGPHLWDRAGDILLAERLRTNTHRVMAIGFPANVLGNTWWALRLRRLSEKRRKSLVLWLNGTLTLLAIFGRRAITQGAWVKIKQPAWESMPVLDVRALTRSQFNALAEAYDRLATQDLRALAQLDQDATRIAIDEALCDALGLPDLKNLRELLAREPGLRGKARRDVGAAELDPPDDGDDEPPDHLV